MAVVTKEDSIRVVDGRLIVDVALDGTKHSASGKSVLLFSTGGNIKLEDGVTLGINAYRKV